MSFIVRIFYLEHLPLPERISYTKSNNLVDKQILLLKDWKGKHLLDEWEENEYLFGCIFHCRYVAQVIKQTKVSELSLFQLLKCFHVYIPPLNLSTR
jgi:hypothetical protein